ncbi:MAG TPA: FxLYD domain-containing protein, partial [Nitrospiria bacterium]|nr:FxLYD domain-containing protein [Nitrospiria bacterium]
AGLLYGVGFGVSAGLIMNFIVDRMTPSFDPTPIDKVSITGHEEVKRAGEVFFLGTLENHASDPVRIVKIQVDLFDKQGKLVEICDEHVRGFLKSTESVNFKVSCGSTGKPVVEHDSYKIHPVGLL